MGALIWMMFVFKVIVQLPIALVFIGTGYYFYGFPGAIVGGILWRVFVVYLLDRFLWANVFEKLQAYEERWFSKSKR